MFYHVLPCFTMFYHVLPCLQADSTIPSLPHQVVPFLEAEVYVELGGSAVGVVLYRPCYRLVEQGKVPV